MKTRPDVTLSERHRRTKLKIVKQKKSASMSILRNKHHLVLIYLSICNTSITDNTTTKWVIITSQMLSVY